MMLSIIIPTKNAGRTLTRLLKSIFSQNPLADYEVIIVDSFSTDNTKEIACNYPVQFLQKETTIYSAMNEGIKAASGDYLYFIGADDELEPGSLDLMVSVEAKLVKGLIYLGDLAHPVYSAYQQTTVYSKQLFDLYGDFDLVHPVYADIWFKKKLKQNGIEPVKVKGVFASVALGGFSSRTRDVM